MVLPVTAIAAPVLMLRAAGAPSYPIHILVRLARVLSKVDSCTEHPTYVGMTLIKSLLCNGLNTNYVNNFKISIIPYLNER